MYSVMEPKKSVDAMHGWHGKEKNADDVRTDETWCEGPSFFPLCTPSCCGARQTSNEVESAWICGVWFSSLPTFLCVRDHAVKWPFSWSFMCYSHSVRCSFPRGARVCPNNVGFPRYPRYTHEWSSSGAMKAPRKWKHTEHVMKRFNGRVLVGDPLPSRVTPSHDRECWAPRERNQEEGG